MPTQKPTGMWSAHTTSEVEVEREEKRARAIRHTQKMQMPNEYVTKVTAGQSPTSSFTVQSHQRQAKNSGREKVGHDARDYAEGQRGITAGRVPGR